jgi:hypothetical protein
MMYSLMSQINMTVPLPWTIATVQLSIGLLCSTIFWLLRTRRMPDLDSISASHVKVVTKVVVYNMIGHVFMVLPSIHMYIHMYQYATCISMWCFVELVNSLTL